MSCHSSEQSQRPYDWNAKLVRMFLHNSRLVWLLLIATVLGGLLPLAIESEFWRGLAVTIMAGIGLSGFFSLVIIPILYVWIESGRARFHRKVRPSGEQSIRWQP